MDKNQKKLILLGGLFIFFGLFSFIFYYSGKSVEGVLLSKNIPIQVEEWEGIDIPMDEKTMTILETRDILFRVYTQPNVPPVYLCVVFAQNNRRSIHPPEVCYIASGWEVGKKRFFPSNEVSPVEPFFDATEILITKNYNKQVVYYWYKAGDLFTSSIAKHQWNMALSQLMLKRIRGALIRISTEVKDESQKEALQRLNQFTSAVLPALQENLP